MRDRHPVRGVRNSRRGITAGLALLAGLALGIGGVTGPVIAATDEGEPEVTATNDEKSIDIEVTIPKSSTNEDTGAGANVDADSDGSDADSNGSGSNANGSAATGGNSSGGSSFGGGNSGGGSGDNSLAKTGVEGFGIIALIGGAALVGGAVVLFSQRRDHA